MTSSIFYQRRFIGSSTFHFSFSSLTPSSPHHSTMYPNFYFPSSSSLSSVFLLIIAIGIHHRHRFPFPRLCLLNLLFIHFLILVTRLGRPMHAPCGSLPKDQLTNGHSLSLTCIGTCKIFFCQMPLKRAKLSLENLSFMRYSEICLVGGCLICGFVNKEIKTEKLGLS